MVGNIVKEELYEVKEPNFYKLMLYGVELNLMSDKKICRGDILLMIDEAIDKSPSIRYMDTMNKLRAIRNHLMLHHGFKSSEADMTIDLTNNIGFRAVL